MDEMKIQSAERRDTMRSELLRKQGRFLSMLTVKPDHDPLPTPESQFWSAVSSGVFREDVQTIRRAVLYVEAAR